MPLDTKTIEQKPEPPKLWVSILGKFVSTILILLCLVVFVVGMWSGIDRATGYSAPMFDTRIAVISSDSMATVAPSNEEELQGGTMHFARNDVVVSKTDITYDDVQIHDIILLDYGGTLIAHRVIQKFIEDDGTQMVVTRGDANTSIDSPMPFSEVKGEVVRVIPKIGGVVLFLQSAYGLLAVSLVVFFICLGIIVSAKVNEKRHYRAFSVDQSRVRSYSRLARKLGERPKDRRDVDFDGF